jgi:hypothetical protein
MSTEYSLKNLKITDSAGTTTSYPFNASYWGGYTMSEICTGTYPDTGKTFVGNNPTAVWNNAYGPYLDKNFISDMTTSGTTLSYEVFNPIQNVGDTKTLSTDTKVKSPYRWEYVSNLIKLYSSAAADYILSLKPIETIDMGITTFVNFKFPLTDTTYVTYKFGGSCSSSAVTGTANQQVLHYKEGSTEYWYKDAPSLSSNSFSISFGTYYDCRSSASSYRLYYYQINNNTSATVYFRYATTEAKAAAGSFDSSTSIAASSIYRYTSGYSNTSGTSPVPLKSTYSPHIAESGYHSCELTFPALPTGTNYRNLNSMGYYASGTTINLINPYHFSVTYSIVQNGVTKTGSISWGSSATITLSYSVALYKPAITFSASGYVSKIITSNNFTTGSAYVYLYNISTTAATLRRAPSVSSSVTYYAYDVATQTQIGSVTCSSSSSFSLSFGSYGKSGGNILISTWSSYTSAVSAIVGNDYNKPKTIYVHLT